MPQPYPQEFRNDVVRVALYRGSKTTITQITKVCGVYEGILNTWIR